MKGWDQPPPVIEIVHVVPIGIIADPAKEPEPKKVAEKELEQPKMKVTVLPKLPATTGTPRKRRMASMLDAVLESIKTSAPASAEALSDRLRMQGKLLSRA